MFVGDSAHKFQYVPSLCVSVCHGPPLVDLRIDALSPEMNPTDALGKLTPVRKLVRLSVVNVSLRRKVMPSSQPPNVPAAPKEYIAVQTALALPSPVQAEPSHLKMVLSDDSLIAYASV